MNPPLATSPLSERPSFEAVYTVGLPFLHQALRWLGVAMGDLDDMLQEVFLAAHRGLAHYDPRRYHGVTGPNAASAAPALRIAPEIALKRWLFGIAWRQASHYHERGYRRREIPWGGLGAWPFDGRDPSLTPEQVLAGADRARVITSLLTKVAPSRRLILILHDVLEAPVAHIARELGLNENTVRSRLRLARADFRAAVARQSRERRQALGDPTAAERPLSAHSAALLRCASDVPAVPDWLRNALWARLRMATSHRAGGGLRPERGFSESDP